MELLTINRVTTHNSQVRGRGLLVRVREPFLPRLILSPSFLYLRALEMSAFVQSRRFCPP